MARPVLLLIYIDISTILIYMIYINISLWKPGGQKQIAHVMISLIYDGNGNDLTWQESSSPIGHMGLVCRGGGKAHTCSSSKAGMKFSLDLFGEKKQFLLF